jgi:hypothetical protein
MTRSSLRLALAGAALLASLSYAAMNALAGPPKPRVPTPIEQRTLTVVKGKPFAKGAAKVRTLPVSAGGVFLANVPIVGGNAVVGTAAHQWGSPNDWTLVDLKSGAKRAKMKFVGEGSAATKSAVVALGATESDHPALLHLEDGRLIEPQPTVPQGKVKAVRIVVDRKKPITWLFALRADGKPFQVQWKDTSNPKVDVDQELPFWPSHFSGKNGVQVWTNSPRGGTGGCDRAYFDDVDPWRCRPLASEDAAPMDLIDECVRSDGDMWVLDDCGGTVPQACGDKARALLMSPDPSRALAVCIDDPQHPKLVLWSPKHTWIWDDAPGASWKGIIPERGPQSVVGLETLTQSGAAVKRWLDVQKGVLFTGPPMRVLQLAEHRDERRRLLQAPDHPKELWVLDVDAGTVERIADDIDCDQTLYTYAQQGDRVTVECMPKAAAANVYKDEARLASWKWMEVIDLKARKRWRTTEVFEPKIGLDGIVVGTKRGKPATLAVIETP